MSPTYDYCAAATSISFTRHIVGTLLRQHHLSPLNLQQERWGQGPIKLDTQLGGNTFQGMTPSLNCVALYDLNDVLELQ